MKSFFFYAIILEAAFLLEGLWAHFPHPYVRVDFVWLIVLSLSFTQQLFPGSLSVTFLGLARESIGASLHGPTVAAYLLIYFFIRIIQRQVFLGERVSQVLWVFVFTLAYKAIEMGLMAWKGFPSSWDSLTLLVTALLESLVAIWFLPFLKREQEEEV